MFIEKLLVAALLEGFCKGAHFSHVGVISVLNVQVVLESK